ncbi:conserved Plasmodium membrane protein, unknown function [Plasmodium gallinaceum]|uniref:Uncharacterized protein n=1 Tax=Plasmodium gallinaceum TaxID=5849 RepID=A0A1J1GM32_PLAGA|nr:conserved Plasmodium membrane protein, unknown function [Plasmodium gallinaceum]CRG93387.1 conserved Plasmodium membrane protein, unknown function [Plasmodium gallinaceum]
MKNINDFTNESDNNKDSENVKLVIEKNQVNGNNELKNNRLKDDELLDNEIEKGLKNDFNENSKNITNINFFTNKDSSKIECSKMNENDERIYEYSSYIKSEKCQKEENDQEKKTEINKKSFLQVSDKDRYEFLKYRNYFFIENKNHLDIYFEAKNVLKNTNPSLLYLLKNISLLSHVIYFHEVREQKLLTSADIENVTNILYKNEDNYSDNYTVVYNCLIFLLEIIKLSSHNGVKNYVYYHLLRNFNKIQILFFDDFCFKKIKNRENFYIIRKNEAIFINDYITLDIIKILNQENKLVRIYGLKLCFIFIKKVSQCNYIINLILNIIFQEMNFDEFYYAFHIFIELLNFLSHDVIYHIVKKFYNSLVNKDKKGINYYLKYIKEKESYRNVPNALFQKSDDDESNDKRHKNIYEKGGIHYLEKNNKNEYNQLVYSLNEYNNNINKIYDNNQNKPRNMTNKHVTNEKIDKKNFFTKNHIKSNNKNVNTEDNTKYEEKNWEYKKKKHLLNILSNHFVYSKCIFLSKIAIKLNKFVPYLSYFLFRKMWNLINSFFEFDYLHDDENIIINILDNYFYGTTVLSCKNVCLTSLQIIIIKLLLNIPHTYLMKKRNISYFALRSLLFLMKKKKIFVSIDNLELAKKNIVNNYFFVKYFSFISTIQYYELLNWLNYLQLSNNPSLLLFIKVVYKFFKIKNEIYGDFTENNNTSPEGSKNNKYDINKSNIDNIKNDFFSLNGTYFDSFINSFLSILEKHNLTDKGFNNNEQNVSNEKLKSPNFIKNENTNITKNEDELGRLNSKEERDIDIKREYSSIDENENNSLDENQKGNFNFTISISDEANENEQQDELINNTSDNGSRIENIDFFFENFIHLAKEKEKNNDINIKNLNITLNIKKKKNINDRENKKSYLSIKKKKKKKKKKSHCLSENYVDYNNSMNSTYNYNICNNNYINYHNINANSNVCINNNKSNDISNNNYENINNINNEEYVNNNDNNNDNNKYINNKDINGRYDSNNNYNIFNEPNKVDNMFSHNKIYTNNCHYWDIYNKTNNRKSNINKNIYNSSINSSIRDENSRSDVISEISNENYFSKDDMTDLAIENERENVNKANRECIFHCCSILKKNKIKLYNLINEDIIDSDIFKDTLFIKFKKEFLKKEKKYVTMDGKYSFSKFSNQKSSLKKNISNDFIMERIIFIKILFFLYKNSIILLIKLNILKVLSILSDYLIFEEDIENFLRIINYFIINFLSNKKMLNENVPSYNIYDYEKNTLSETNKIECGDIINNIIYLNTKKKTEVNKNNFNKYPSYNSDSSKSGSIIMSSDSSLNKDKNFDIYINNIFNIKYNIISNQKEILYYNQNTLRKYIRIYLLDVIDKLLYKKNNLILNSLFHLFYTNNFILFFDLFLISNKEKIIEVLNDPFFYLINKKSNDKSNNNLNENNIDIDIDINANKKEECSKIINYNINNNLDNFYLIKRRKFFQFFQFDQISYRNVKLLFYFSFFNFVKDRNIMNQFRKKVIIFLNILNNIFHFKRKKYIHCFLKKKKRKNKRYDKKKIKYVDNPNIVTKNEYDNKKKEKENQMDKNELSLHYSHFSQINSYSNNNNNLMDKKNNTLPFNQLGHNYLYSNSSSDYSTSSISTLSLSQSSSSNSFNESVDSSYSDSISSISNKSIKNKLKKIYENLHNEEKNVYEKIKIKNLRKDDNSYFYIYKVGLFCITSGFYKYSYKIFEKLYYLITNRDIKLWCKCLLNYSNFYNVKKQKNNNKKYYNPINFLNMSEQCIKQMFNYKDNFFHMLIFLEIKVNLYKAIENLIILINDIKNEINFTIKYFSYNIEKFISSLKNIMIAILIFLNFKYIFSSISKKILIIYIILIKSLFILCNFLKNKVIPYLFLNSSFLVNIFVDEYSDEENENDLSDGLDQGISNFIRFYLQKKKEKKLRKTIFTKELKNTEGKLFNEIFDYIITMLKINTEDFFFYDYIENLIEIYHNLFKDNIINKKKIINYIYIYLLVIYKINYPTPPRVLSSAPIPFVSSSTYIYKSNRGKGFYEVESVKCIGELKNAKKQVIKDFYYCNIKLIFKNKIMRDINVRSQGIHVLYTFHIKIENDDLKYFNIFLIPLDKYKKLLGQAKPTSFFFKYI